MPNIPPLFVALARRSNLPSPRMFAAVAAWFMPAGDDRLKGSPPPPFPRHSYGSNDFAAREGDLLALAGVQGASHLKVGTPDRFHNVVKIPARAPADPPLPPLVRARAIAAFLPVPLTFFGRSLLMATAPVSACFCRRITLPLSREFL